MSIGPDRRFPPLAIRAQLRWELVRPIVEETAPATTIEVGTGLGAMGARIAEMTSRSYIGVELDSHSYEVAKRRIEPFGGVVHRQLLDDLSPRQAEMLCAFEVLEHMEDDVEAVRQWVSYVAPGGLLLISVPAFQHRYGPLDTQAGHFRRYSPDELTRLVESVGMVDVSAQLYGAPLGYALEAVRNRMDAKKLAGPNGSNDPIEVLTAASGRTNQFDRHSWKSTLVTAGTYPFKHLQRVWPGGVGVVLSARKPRS